MFIIHDWPPPLPRSAACASPMVNVAFFKCRLKRTTRINCVASPRRIAAIDHQHLAGHEGRLGADQEDDGVTIAMSWEKRMIPFKVEVDRKALQMAAFINDFRTTRPYYDYMTAANWCVQNNYGLEQALQWMDRAIYFRVMGEKNFRTLNAKANVLTKMNRIDEAKKVMEEAIPMGTMIDVHFYARQLLGLNQVDDAFKIFKANYDKYPGEATTNVGMGRAYSAKGDYKKALTYMESALKKATDEAGKNNILSMIAKLKEGKNVN